MLTVYIAIGLFFKFIVTPYVELTSKTQTDTQNNKVETIFKISENIKIPERSSNDLLIKFTSAKLENQVMTLSWRAKGTDDYNSQASICVYAFNKEGKVVTTLNNKSKKALMGDMGPCGYSTGGETIPLYLGEAVIAKMETDFDLTYQEKYFEEKPYAYKVEALVLDGRTGTTEWAGLVASDVYDSVLVVGDGSGD